MSRTKADSIQATLKKLKDEANEKEVELLNLMANIYESVKEKKDEAIDKVQEGATAVNTSVHMHPWSYIGGAALGGFLLGFLCRK